VNNYDDLSELYDELWVYGVVYRTCRYECVVFMKILKA
jgi:hypothetical protein